MRKRKSNAKVTPELKEKMQQMRDQGMTLEEIGQETGFAPVTVWTHVKTKPDESRELTEDRIAEFQTLREQGMATDQIARKCKVSRDTVIKYTSRPQHGRPIGPPKGGKIPEFFRMTEPIKIEGRKGACV